MQTKTSQLGITFIGFLLAAMLVVGAAVVAMKLYPLYYEKFQLIQSLESVSTSATADWTMTDVKRALLKNFEVQDIRDNDLGQNSVGNTLTIEKDDSGNGRQLTMDYEMRREFLGELDVVMKFHHSVPLPGKAE